MIAILTFFLLCSAFLLSKNEVDDWLNRDWFFCQVQNFNIHGKRGQLVSTCAHARTHTCKLRKSVAGISFPQKKE